MPEKAHNINNIKRGVQGAKGLAWFPYAFQKAKYYKDIANYTKQYKTNMAPKAYKENAKNPKNPVHRHRTSSNHIELEIHKELI